MFRLFFSVVVTCALAIPAPLDNERPQHTALLEKARIHMIQNLMRQPNYTCLQTIERTIRRGASRRFELFDMIRLEVALVNGRELFSWPAAHQFDDKSIDELVTGGAIGNGSFALHAKSIFQGSPQYKYVGEETVAGRKLFRWNYHVGLLSSGFTLRAGGKEAIVGFHGSFWIEPDSLDVTRIEVEAEDIPLDLHLLRASDSVDYVRAPIGDKTFLLPKTAELRMLDDSNVENVNRIRFTSCRQYLGESRLIFSDPDEPASASAEQIQTVVLPAGLTLHLSLETPIRAGESAVGDPVSLILKNNIKRDGVIYFEKGAIVHGRITMLRNMGPGWAVGILPSEIQSRGKHAVINATKIDYGPVSVGELNSGLRSSNQSRQMVVVKLPHAPGSVFYVHGTTLHLTRGIMMYWRTESSTDNGDTK